MPTQTTLAESDSTHESIETSWHQVSNLLFLINYLNVLKH